MEASLEACLTFINQAEKPVPWTELIAKNNIPPDNQDKILSTLKARSDIFFHDYSDEDYPLILFWRKDLRDKAAEDHFTRWEKQAAITLSEFSNQPLTSKEKHTQSLEMIDAMHKYNDLKDAGQLLLGKYAESEGITIAQAYTQFDLSLND